MNDHPTIPEPVNVMVRASTRFRSAGPVWPSTWRATYASSSQGTPNITAFASSAAVNPAPPTSPLLHTPPP
jgi:hypothetical protein